MKSVMTKFVLFTNFNPKFLENTSSKITYSQDTHEMIVKCTGKAHAAIANSFNDEIIKQVAAMSLPLADSLLSTGDGRCRGNVISKDPDYSVRPKSQSLPPSRSTDWPSIVVEVGVSEKLPQSMKDATFWLSNSNNDVKMVIVVSIDPLVPNILFRCVMISGTLVERNGRTKYIYATRQEMQIKRNAARACVTTNGPLVIHFEELFLRQPMAPETDITLRFAILEGVAHAIWDDYLHI
ncbi:hypothetical protein N7495_008550 [Penicillium taxi]|uniref:uncharacterized protein n=1 Tax=Penicillium taxi TaxID=168475 RepID=UPI002545A5FC|nr:uncharacterized protein N7495_008550 [Penicillium taxi]KAJ5888509.1 hypothetical protein N7495_008550 [Penicillium taxi]